MLALAIVGGVVLSYSAPGPTAFDRAASELVAQAPGLRGVVLEVAYDLLIIWSFCLLLLSLFAPGRKRLFLYEVLAVAVGLGFAILAGTVSGIDPSKSLSGLINSTSPPIYVATRVAIATTVIVTASPFLTRPIRLIGRWLIAIGALSGIALGAALPIGVGAGFLIGLGSAALVHLLFGSPGGRLTLDQVTEALRELGVEATATRDAPLQPRGVAVTLASTPEGRPLVVKIFGRDAQDGQLVAATWSAIWRRGAKPVSAGRLEQVEHASRARFPRCLRLHRDVAAVRRERPDDGDVDRDDDDPPDRVHGDPREAHERADRGNDHADRPCPHRTLEYGEAREQDDDAADQVGPSPTWSRRTRTRSSG